MNKISAIFLVVFLGAFFSNSCRINAAIVYQENFDDGTCSLQTSNPEICWCTGSSCCYIPNSSSTPLCMSGRALRTNDSANDPIIGMDLRGCTGTATLSLTYYQFAAAGVVVKKGSVSSGTLDCSSPPTLSTYVTLTTVGSCQSLSIPLTPDAINYVQFDHPPGNTNALYIDGVSVDATCPVPSCGTTFSADFGTTFHSGSVCTIFPAQWELCTGNGPYLSSMPPCGGTVDYVMALGQGYPYSSAETVCVDLSGISSATLTYQYSWDGLFSTSPTVEISIDGGSSWTTLKEHAGTSGSCDFVCLDLATYIGNTDVRFKFASRSSSTSYHAYFDDIVLNRNQTCPSTPTPTSTVTPTSIPSLTPTQEPTSTPTVTPTPSPAETDTPFPTETSTQFPTDTPTSIPSETPTEDPSETPSPQPTPTLTPEPTETPASTSSPTVVQPTMTPFPVPASTPAGTGILIAFLTVLIAYSLSLSRR